jgi:hypothetical protein
VSNRHNQGYWLTSSDVMEIFRSFNRIWLRQETVNDQPAYKKTVLVDHGLGADLIMKTILDRQVQYGGDNDFGMSVVNTDNSNGKGYHWVIVLFKRVHTVVDIRVYDPMVNADACTTIWENILLTKNDNFTVKSCICTPLGWQKDGWRCGYYCVYALLAAGLTAHEQVTQDALLNPVLNADGELEMKKMPRGFEHVVWTLLKTIGSLKGNIDLQHWRDFCLNYFGQDDQELLFSTRDAAALAKKARDIETAYKQYLSNTLNI